MGSRQVDAGAAAAIAAPCAEFGPSKKCNWSQRFWAQHRGLSLARSEARSDVLQFLPAIDIAPNSGPNLERCQLQEKKEILKEALQKLQVLQDEGAVVDSAVLDTVEVALERYEPGAIGKIRSEHLERAFPVQLWEAIDRHWSGPRKLIGRLIAIVIRLLSPPFAGSCG